jgi:hypothetical protein
LDLKMILVINRKKVEANEDKVRSVSSSVVLKAMPAHCVLDLDLISNFS